MYYIHFRFYINKLRLFFPSKCPKSVFFPNFMYCGLSIKYLSVFHVKETVCSLFPIKGIKTGKQIVMAGWLKINAGDCYVLIHKRSIYG